MRNSTVRNMTQTALFASLIAIGAFIKLPLGPVPVTMQTFFVLLSGYTLGASKGTLSVIIYILLGLFGLPVFAEGGGISYLLKPTFGFLIGFIPCSALTGFFSERIRPLNKKLLAFSGIIGIFIVYLTGAVYCIAVSRYVLDLPVSLGSLITNSLLITLPVDLISVVIASLLSVRVKSALGQ